MMTNLIIGGGIYLEGKQVEESRSYKYLRHEIYIGRTNKSVYLTWVAFG